MSLLTFFSSEWTCPTYRYFIHGYIYNTANHYDEVKQIPSIYKVVL